MIKRGEKVESASEVNHEGVVMKLDWRGGSAIDFGVVVLQCYSCDADQTEGETAH